ncbi:hypothetical protein [Bacillus altitudinis]|uniref:hypothetical protein n=1 Tax=Bacillus altitudinis TaxID=293387 RepID=UPI002ACE13A2|nr:hypothetical protein [Bacillus altitudinis]WQH37841.1 hypothetical protein U2873_13515 [Bacillus altitudinis]
MRNRKMYSNIIFFIIILSLFLGDLLIYTGLLNMFFEEKETIWAGIIGFTGAVLGGGITYYGIRMQLNHRDRELFFQTVHSRMEKCKDFLNEFQDFFESAIEHKLMIKDFDYHNSHSRYDNTLIKNFCEIINTDRISYMSVLDYESAKKAKELRISLNYKMRTYVLEDITEVYEALEEIIEFRNLFYNTLQQLEDTLIDLKK